MIGIPSVKPVSARSRMAEQVIFTTTKSTGTWGGSSTARIYSTSPRITVEWGGTGWSGGTATQTYTTTQDGSEYYADISRVCSGAGTKTITVYPTNTSGNRIGEITSISVQTVSNTLDARITAIDGIKNCRKLRTLSVLASYTGTGLDVSGLKSLTVVQTVNSSSLNTVDVTGCSSLQYLQLNGSFSSITGLSSTQSTLQVLNINNNTNITSLDVSNFSSLYGLSVEYCSALTSLRAQNVMLYETTPSYYVNYMYFQDGGAQLQSTGLDASALNQFFTDLATNTSGAQGLIGIYLTPGVATCNISIATNKGYTVLGTLPP